jgi:RNA polymerase sigma factor (sigma-70 family)
VLMRVIRLSLKAWLLTILHRLFLDGQRRQAAERRRDAKLEDLGTTGAGQGDQEQAVYLSEVAARFAALPDEQRAVLHLVGVEGLTYHEASLALEAPIGTIMSRLSRARAALRKGEALAPEVARFLIVGGKDAS